MSHPVTGPRQVGGSNPPRSLIAPVRLATRTALYLLLVVTVANASSVLGPVLGLSIYLLLLGLCSAGLLLAVASRAVSPRPPPVVILFAVAITTMVPAALAARNGADAWSALLDLAKDAWFLLVVVLLGRELSNPAAMAKVVVGTMTILAVLTTVNEFVLGEPSSFGGFAVVSESLGVGTTTARHAASFEDPNFYGRLLALALPLALALGARAWPARQGSTVLLWACSAGVITTGVYLTQSRGAMLAAGVGIVVWACATGRGTRRALMLSPLVVLLLASVPGVGSRLATLADLTPQPFAERDGSIVERSAAQQVMTAIFTDNPALGVGPDNTGYVWWDYAGAADRGITREVAPHNLYLELAAETGVLGLLGWLIFLGGSIVLALRLVIANPPGHPASVGGERVMGAGLAGAVASWATASVFLHLAHLRPLLLVLAVLGVMRLDLTRVTAAAALPYPRHRRWWSWKGVVAGMVAGATALVLVAVVLPRYARDEVWTARVPFTLVPTPGPDRIPDPYQQVVVTERATVATFAAVVQQVGDPIVAAEPGFELAVVGTGEDAVFIVEVSGPDRLGAESLAGRVAERGRSYIGEQPMLSSFATAHQGVASSAEDREWVFGS